MNEIKIFIYLRMGMAFYMFFRSYKQTKDLYIYTTFSVGLNESRKARVIKKTNKR